VTLELAGVAFLVAVPLILSVTTSLLHAAVAATLGVGVAGWGLLSRVRRRVASGAVVVVIALVLLVAVPLVSLLPAWSGASLWILVASVGVLAVCAATLLEKARTAARAGRTRLGALTQGWE